MKREHRLRYIIKEGLLDTFYIWKDELRNVFKDAGVMIFFFLVPFVYPLLYSFIYNNEVVHEAKMVVVDQSDSYLSREFTRRVNALFLDLCRSSLERAGTILYVGRVRLVVGISDLAVPYRAELEEGVVGFQISTVKTVCDEKRTSFTIYHKGRSSGYVLYLEG